jgi:hypothetical protein
MAEARIQFRRGTAAEWTSANPTLAVGELGFETDTTKFKIGDGSTAWTSLAYGFTAFTATAPITITDGAIGITEASLTIAQSQVTNLETDLSGKQAVVSGVDDTEIGYLNGVTSAIQTQLDGKLALSGGTLTGALTLSADPAAALQAATKQYVDAVSEGLHVHASVAAASTANIDLSTGGLLTIDGVALLASDRVLVKNQTAPAQNGIYVAASGAWTRAADYDSTSEIDSGDFVFVSAGTLYDSTGWVQTNAVETLGTDPIEWSQFSGAGTFTAGAGLTLTGTVFAADTSVLATQTYVDNGLATKEPTITGGATTITDTNLTASRALASDGSGKVAVSAVTATELGYVSGVTSAIQTQIDGKLASDGNATTATTATNLAGGAAGKVPYQSGSGTTVFTDVGEAGQLLTSNGTSAPTWQSAPETGFNAFLLSGM